MDEKIIFSSETKIREIGYFILEQDISKKTLNRNPSKVKL